MCAFPTAPGLKFSKPTDMKSRLAAISGFLAEARRRLTPYNVFLAADIFGYVAWNLDDTHIGQRLEELAPIVDYISPMLYPSCFQFGIPGYRNPVAHPYEIVFLSLQNARERGIRSNRFRPWLQAFRDYAFDHREFTGTQIRAANFGRRKVRLRRLDAVESAQPVHRRRAERGGCTLQARRHSEVIQSATMRTTTASFSHRLIAALAFQLLAAILATSAARGCRLIRAFAGSRSAANRHRCPVRDRSR